MTEDYTHVYNAKVSKWLEPNEVALEIDLGFRKWILQSIELDKYTNQSEYPPGTLVRIQTRLEKNASIRKYRGSIGHRSAKDLAIPAIC